MKRTMLIHYPHEKELIDRLDTCLKMCCMPHVIFDDRTRYTIYIDKGNCTWQQVMREVNRVHAVKFNYVTNESIEIWNGKTVCVTHCGTIYA